MKFYPKWAILKVCQFGHPMLFWVKVSIILTQWQHIDSLVVEFWSLAVKFKQHVFTIDNLVVWCLWCCTLHFRAFLKVLTRSTESACKSFAVIFLFSNWIRPSKHFTERNWTAIRSAFLRYFFFKITDLNTALQI